MANYDTLTKVLIIESNDNRASTVTGSAAKTVNDFIETIVNTKTIRAITTTPISNTKLHVMVIYDA